MKLRELMEKGKALCKKAGTKTLIAMCAVLVLGCAVVLNFILGGGEPANPGSKMAIDLTSSGEQTSLKPDEVQDYFASISLQRKQARDEAVEVLKTVSESDTALEEAKQAALTDINKIARDIEAEANIESLIQAKGFAQCVAVISEEKCSVIVESTGLLPGEAAQISEIVYEQAGILPENLKIIERNGQA